MTPLAEEIAASLKRRPQQFAEVADDHRDVPWRRMLQAWGEIRRADVLKRDDDGRYFIGGEGESKG